MHSENMVRHARSNCAVLDDYNSADENANPDHLCINSSSDDYGPYLRNIIPQYKLQSWLMSRR